MREENKWRTFLLAFTLTLMLLAFIMVLTVMAVQPSMPRQNIRDDPPEISSIVAPTDRAVSWLLK